MTYSIAVVGSGAVGCYYGAHLARSGEDVRFLMRGDLEHVRENGILIRSAWHEDFRVDNIQCYGSVGEIGPVDLVIVALKSTENDALESLIPPLLHKRTRLLTLQNGLGNCEFLAGRFGAERVMGGLCFVCLNRVSPGVIHHMGYGLIMLGEFGGKPIRGTRLVGEHFSASGLHCEVVDDLVWAQWRKLVWNIPFNGLAILGGGISVDRILADEDLQVLAREVMEEIIRAAGVQGHEFPESLIEDQVEKTGKMGAYRPSSMVDFVEGRAVEVEAIWGEPWRRGLAAGADVGRLEMMYRLVRNQVNRRTSSERDAS